MKRNYLLLLIGLLCFSVNAKAQYPVGHKSVTYQDPARSNRNVTTEIYYPATSAGDNTSFASGQFPMIIFGHGFVMGYDAYAYFRNAIVPFGYIIIFPTTESSMSPVHADFGADMAFLINQMQTEGGNSSSFFFNHISPLSAVMGHSMGGGASFLACKNNTVPTCMVTFAAANTDPSSITAASQVSIPALVISGSADCVAAPSDNQIPMYDSLASGCKVYISIKNGCHCYFADYNFSCAFGEGTCNPTPSLSRADQQDATLDFVKIYLDYYLKGNANSWNTFNDSLSQSPRITFQKSCVTTNISENISLNELTIWPNPANEIITAHFNSIGKYSLSVSDVQGKRILVRENNNFSGSVTESIPVNGLKKGLYFLELKTDEVSFYKKFIKE